MTWVSGQMKVPREFAFKRIVELARDSALPLPAGSTDALNTPYISDTGELTFDADKKLLLLNAPMAAGMSGTLGVGITQTAGPIDFQLAASARGFASVLVTSLDNRPIAHSSSLLVSLPGATLRSLPAPGERPPATGTTKPQGLVNYLGDSSWWTVDPANSNPTWGNWIGKTPPSGNMSNGYPPIFMERIQCWITLHTQATAVTVTALDGAGNAMGTLPATEIQKTGDGYRIRLQGDGQPQSPWFTITASWPENLRLNWKRQETNDAIRRR
jgi:hypothetical protein